MHPPARRTAGLAVATALAASLAAPAARAGTISVQLDGPGAPDFAQRLGLSLPALQAQLEGELTKAYQLVNGQSYVRNFGDAFAFTTKGLGVDYASNASIFVVGIAGNLSLNVQNAYAPDSKTRPPIDAMGLDATIMGGVSLTSLGVPVRLYGNWYKGTATFDQHKGDLSNWGVHAQVRLLAPRKRSGVGLPIRWNGIDVTSGVDYGRLKLSLGSGTIKTVVPVDSAFTNVDLLADITGTFNLDMRTYSVPLEVTTNLTLLYFLTVYGGVGFDWQVGGGHDMVMNLTGDVTGRAPALGIDKQSLGRVTMTATEHVDPSIGHMRGLIGVELSALFVKLFAQLNWMPDKNLAGVGFGARVAY